MPQNPGVYFFRGKKSEILYIGKATNLKSRVQSYFRADVALGRSQWIASMVSQIAKIDFEQTDSVLEALILESNLIKKHQPKYNIQEKDDKSFSYFVVTKEEFPRVLIVRKTDLDKMSKSKLKVTNKTQFSNGKISKKFKYKDALIAKYYGPYTSKKQMEIALKIVRKIFPFHALNQKNEKGCLDFQIGLCPGPYARAISKFDYNKNIRNIKMILEGKKKRLVANLEKEMNVSAEKNEFEKAAALRNKIFALQHIRDVALISKDFETEAYLPDDPTGTTKSKAVRIEAYDISNISGTNAVGSMVVFVDGKSDKTQYRKFKIKTVEGSNDVAMMREVLLRRFKNDWPMPDLVLLDGGAGHVNMADELLHEQLGLAVEIIGVAKGPSRKNLNFQFPISNKIPMSQFPKEMQEFLNNKNLVKSIMDEAHRFAITYHRKLRAKSLIS